ncbi:tetratricopeptide repeat protein [Roseicyclus mahoneyensis]|uniref:Tetratricopeptide repeat protein n=1 Tax=Roseicyclus mahoneyensis TaxID=164332 RepID=A0A316GEU0_9RHOB|nr:tetratricopeptide repeat protein [Roseicyclus mahoneyensis]PWK59408.1 tetratricopeptide repeat protein [Roseicyclus mahoneyensis]
MRGLIILSAITGLAACVGTSDDGRLDPLAQDLEIAAPAGTVVLQEGVDQILVGDRLMDAGQHELALRSYYRAAADRGLDADVLTSIGAANLALGRIGQAETLFRQALDENDRFVPAWNNLGVTLMEQGEYGEARRVFEHAFALDSGLSDAIRDNLRLAIARMENNVYSEPNNQNGLGLIRRGGGVYELRVDP